MKTAIVVIGAAAMLICGEYAMAQEHQHAGNVQKKEIKTQTTCPIMGGAINKKHFADHDGKRVYFCCPGCNETFQKDPAKHIKKFEDSGVTLDKTPAKNDDKTASKGAEGPAAPKAHGGACCGM